MIEALYVLLELLIVDSTTLQYESALPPGVFPLCLVLSQSLTALCQLIHDYQVISTDSLALTLPIFRISVTIASP
jgi:hypothetical protein